MGMYSYSRSLMQAKLRMEENAKRHRQLCCSFFGHLPSLFVQNASCLSRVIIYSALRYFESVHYFKETQFEQLPVSQSAISLQHSYNSPQFVAKDYCSGKFP